MAYFTRSTMVFMGLSMYEANERFNQGSTGDRESDIYTLIECQQKALVLGEYLESFGMDYSDIVSDIEEYCNCVYDIAENLEDRAVVIDRKYKIDKQLALIIKKIQDRIIEISSIDIFDFSNLDISEKESEIVTREINRLYDDCITADGDIEESDEFSRSLVVGTY